jgi:hypothetical protein
MSRLNLSAWALEHRRMVAARLLDEPQQVPGIGERGLELDRAPQRLGRLVEAAQLAQPVSEVRPHLREARLAFEHAPQALDAGAPPPGLQVRHALVEIA